MKSIISFSRVWLSVAVSGVCFGIWATLIHLPDTAKILLPKGIDYSALVHMMYGALLLSIYGVIASFINNIVRGFKSRYLGNPVLSRLIPLARLLKISILLIIANQGFSTLTTGPWWNQVFHQTTRVVGNGTLGWFLFELIEIGEALLLQHLPKDTRGSIDTRQRYTYIAIVKRLLVTLLVVLTIAVILMGFEKIRVAGTAILASAGVLTTIVGFSARGLFESLFKGIQLIIVQPIRLLDTIAIDGEVGVVTSITLHHTVVTLSDQSQLIVPSSYFLDKVFKNWTHSSNNLIGNVSFFIKNNTSIDLVKGQFYELLKASQYWDENVKEARVNDLKANLIELKLTMSAKTTADLSKLRSEILEKLLDYMQAQHPENLP